MSILSKDGEAFEKMICEQFGFLETDFDLRYAGTNAVEGDPRESYFVAKYRQNEFRVDIAWNPYAMSLGVLIRVVNIDLRRRARYVYLEPFVEFASAGKTLPIVPQIYPGMSVEKIKRAMHRREKLFMEGFENVICKIADRLKRNLATIRDTCSETIQEYQSWYQHESSDLQ